MITIFTLPKPFNERTRDPQNNAIESWKRVHPDVQIILAGSDEGIKEACLSHGVEHVPDVATNEFGTPLLDSAFQLARARARNPFLCYVNADIIFLADLRRALERIRLPRFLMVGERQDLDVTGPLSFDGAWESELRARALREGARHGPTGMDYFIFPSRQPLFIHPFPVGRAMWDNWMILNARTLGVPVVDASKVVLAVHQNHDYRHMTGERARSAALELERNRQMVGPDFFPMTIADATWQLDDGALRKARDLRHLGRRAWTLPAVVPALRPSIRLVKWLRSRAQRAN